MRQTSLWIWCVIYKAATINFNFTVYDANKWWKPEIRPDKNTLNPLQNLYTYRTQRICDLRLCVSVRLISWLTTHTNINNGEFKSPYRIERSNELHASKYTVHNYGFCSRLCICTYINMLKGDAFKRTCSIWVNDSNVHRYVILCFPIFSVHNAKLLLWKLKVPLTFNH